MTSSPKIAKSNKPNEIINLFSKANHLRLQNTSQSINQNQNDFLELLPYLFQYNHKELPGYVSDTTPSGIAQYQPHMHSIKKVKKLFPSYKHIRRAKKHVDIDSLFLMGSAGSIAYSEKSDFDFWLIHSDKLESRALDELIQKTKLIEKWAETLKLEVHFFCFDAHSFRAGQHESLSTESSGSTQHSLLLDEFYRSNILIAGKKPIWWLIPSANEHQYTQYIDMLEYTDIIDKSAYIDLGSPVPISTSEFFSAAVWQLYKAINSPYKSVLKLLLMEVYASQHPKTNLLSNIFKSKIYQGITDQNNLDPYIIMYQAVEDYLIANSEYERLDIFRQCFYFKIGEKLSVSNIKGYNSQRRILLKELITKWDWDNSKCSLLDMNHKWRIDDLSRHRKKLVNTLTTSYKFLSEFARNNPDIKRVNENELNVLGRKLYTAFEKKNHKVELINYSADDLYETEITLQETKNSDEQIIWNLYRGKIKKEHLKDHRPIKKTYDIMNMLIWCHINRVANQHSAILLHNDAHAITTREIKDIFYAFQHSLSKDINYQANFNDLSNPARVISANMFINVGIDPFNLNKDEISHVTSIRQDALSYGGKHQNLIYSIDFIVLTSWEEVLIYRYNNIDGLIKCILDFLSWMPREEIYNKTDFNVYGLSTSYGKIISNRVEKLISNIFDNFFKYKKDKKDIKYILEVEDQFYVLEFHLNKITKKHFKQFKSLTKYLESYKTYYSEIIFDSDNKWSSVLPEIYKHNEEHLIQTFFQIENKLIKMYVLDEKGCLFTHQISFYNTQFFISHYDRFYKSILDRNNFLAPNDNKQKEINVSFYEIKKVKNNLTEIVKLDLKSNNDDKHFLNIKVIGSMDETDKNHLSIYCNNKEFSSIDYGENVLKVVAEYVLSIRKTQDNYPIYITDIDFSRNIVDAITPQSLQMIHFLKYKKLIEEKLNSALTKISQ